MLKHEPEMFGNCDCGFPPIGPKEIDGLIVPPSKASTLRIGHLITGQQLSKMVHVKPSMA